jgi:hypothetical protein
MPNRVRLTRLAADATLDEGQAEALCFLSAQIDPMIYARRRGHRLPPFSLDMEARTP